MCVLRVCLYHVQELEDEDAYPLPLPPEEVGTAMMSGHQRCKELSLVEEIAAVAGRLVPNLAIRPVVEMVIQAMQALPADMPAVFRNAYKVTNHPGTPQQVGTAGVDGMLAQPIRLQFVSGHTGGRMGGSMALSAVIYIHAHTTVQWMHAHRHTHSTVNHCCEGCSRNSVLQCHCTCGVCT